MSVAFRRESDEEHKEPRFELPIPPGPNLVTPRGLAQIAARVEAIEAEVATSDAAPDDPVLIDRRRDLRYWRTRLATAQLAPSPPEGEAGIGTRVHFTLDGSTRVVEIVGGDEADPAQDRLAFSAPLARALIGAVEGDRVAFSGLEDAIEILGVESIG